MQQALRICSLWCGSAQQTFAPWSSSGERRTPPCLEVPAAFALEHVAAAVDARPAVPHREYAVVLRPREHAGSAACPRWRWPPRYPRFQPGPKLDVMLVEVRACTCQRLVEVRRAGAGGRPEMHPRGIETQASAGQRARCSIGEARDGLQPGEKDPAALQGVACPRARSGRARQDPVGAFTRSPSLDTQVRTSRLPAASGAPVARAGGLRGPTLFLAMP